ncbi:MAG TPA: DUF1707 domain-containing protein [Propionibacterium sp.]|nr:DUF1707 domain-containing protein [Propionibacterium sp.]
MSHDPVPQRLSDAERDAAAAMLREHYEAGRLDATEFDERLSTALSARYGSDLDALFSDLPEPRPTPGHAPAAPAAWSRPSTPLPARRPDAGVPAPSGGTDWVGVARGAIWPVAILLALISGSWGTFIIIAIVGSIVLGQIANNRRKPPPYLDQGPPPPELDR